MENGMKAFRRIKQILQDHGKGNIVVVKKTFRYPDVFFYYRNTLFLQPLMPHSLFRNINMEKGIIGKIKKPKAI
jgi:hypothetical protein